MNRPLTLAATVLAAGAVIVGTAGCTSGEESAPATTTVETEAPAPTTTQAPVTVTEQDENDDNQDQNDDNQDQNDDDRDDNEDRGEAVGRSEEQAGLSKARQECLANAPSAADCANIP